MNRPTHCMWPILPANCTVSPLTAKNKNVSENIPLLEVFRGVRDPPPLSCHSSLLSEADINLQLSSAKLKHN